MHGLAPRHSPEYNSDYSDTKPRWVSQKNQLSKIRYAEKGIASRPDKEGVESETVASILKTAALKWPSVPALRIERPCPPLNGVLAPKSKPLDQWATWTYAKYHHDVRQTAKGFHSLKLERFETVLFAGLNSPEVHIGMLGVVYMGGIPCGSFPTDSSETVALKCKLANVVGVVTDQKNFEKIKYQINCLPSLRFVITFENLETNKLTRENGSSVCVLTFKSLMKLGRRKVTDCDLDKLTSAILPGSCCFIAFTAGLTDDSKPVMVSHDSVLFLSTNIVKYELPSNVRRELREFRFLSYLTMGSTSGWIVDLISPLVYTAAINGYATVYFARPYDLRCASFVQRLQAIKPHLFISIPKVWEQIESKLRDFQKKSSGYRKTILDLAQRTGAARYKDQQTGVRRMTTYQAITRVGYHVADQTVFKKIRTKLGLDQCSYMFTASSSLAASTIEFLASLGVNVCEIYSMSECSGLATWSNKETYSWGSVGYPPEGIEIKVLRKDPNTKALVEAPPVIQTDKIVKENIGEICHRGRHIMMGYYCNENLPGYREKLMDLNRNTIDEDGWLHTGDIGYKTTKGIISILGRQEDLIESPNDIPISPCLIQNAIKEICRVISQVVICTGDETYTMALITLKVLDAGGFLPGTDDLHFDAQAFGCTKVFEAASNDDYILMITKAIQQVNMNRRLCPTPRSHVAKFTILPHNFCLKYNELSQDLTVKRNFILEKQKPILSMMRASNSFYVPCHYS